MSTLLEYFARAAISGAKNIGVPHYVAALAFVVLRSFEIPKSHNW